MTTLDSTAPAAPSILGIDGELVWHALAATRAAAVAAARWAGSGEPLAADGAATSALRAALRAAPGTGTVVTGEGAKDDAPMLADGEQVGDGDGPEYDIAVDPLECTGLCADGLPGAISVMAIAPRGALWSPGAAFYMDKLVLPPAARGCAALGDPPERIVAQVAAALGRPPARLTAFVLDKPRHAELIARLRGCGVSVTAPPAGDVEGSLAVLDPARGAHLLLGVGGTPEGVLTACAARALGGGMQARLAPQRDGERRAVAASGGDPARLLTVEDLVAADAAFVATGVTGGLLGAPRRTGSSLVTDSLVIAAGAVHRIRQSTPTQE